MEALYMEYSLGTDLSNICIPLKLGDTIGITYVTTGEQQGSVHFRIVDSIGPIETDLFSGVRQAWMVQQGIADYSKEIPWLQSEAARGNSIAQDGLGYVYQYGMGVPQDRSQAVNWYQKAAAQGNSDAQSRLQSLGD